MKMRQCIAILGGSFDPVHNGHLALGRHVCATTGADQLRLLPAGQPWQKGSLRAGPHVRAEMLQLAFADSGLPTDLDLREADQDSPCFTVQTLRALRAEVGPDVSLVFVLGADQWQRLHTWREWEQLFVLAHLAVVSRPGFDCTAAPVVAQQAQARFASPVQLRDSAAGHCLLLPDLAHDVSATRVRQLLAQSVPDWRELAQLLPAKVLDYIQYHQLYRHGN